MPTKPHTLTVWFITDDKPGHRSQLQGLEQSLQSKITLNAVWMPAGIRAGFKVGKEQLKPDMIVGAGHATHKSVLYFAKKFRAFSVLLMKPSLPIRWFDAVICPEHDHVKPRKNVLSTKGMINKVVPSEASHQREGGVILLGGPSKHFTWEDETVIEQLETVCSNHQEIDWQIFSSRRTPESMCNALKRKGIKNALVYDDLSMNVGEAILQAEYVWVSQDSMSMIYEALTAGARVGLLSLPPKHTDGRINQSLKQLIAQEVVVDFFKWQNTSRYASPGELNEASKAASWLLEHYHSQSRI